MLHLPRRMKDVRSVLGAINFSGLQAQVEAETRAHLAIIGPVNAGKSSLFNALYGRDVSAVSPVPGTTQVNQTEALGPFTLIDTPGFGEAAGQSRAALAEEAIANADVVVIVYDAVAGIRQADVDLYQHVRIAGKPVVVTLNKIDAIRTRERASVMSDAEHKLEAIVIPISARTGDGIANYLIPAVLETQPKVAVAIGRALPEYRHGAVNRVIRDAAIVAGGIGWEPVPLIDLPLLVTHQLGMVLRIAAIYGEPLNVHHASELISTIAGGLGVRYLGVQAAKFLPGPGWLISAAFAAGGTVAIGKAADAYFESGKKLDAQQLQAMYRQLRRQKHLKTG